MRYNNAMNNTDKLAQVSETILGFGGLVGLWLLRKICQPTQTAEFLVVLTGQVLYVLSLLELARLVIA